MKFKKMLSKWLQADTHIYTHIVINHMPHVTRYSFGKASKIVAVTLSQWN